MKRILTISLLTGALAASIIYIIYRANKNEVDAVILDFAEYALGGK